jgi:hypothetical protein
VGRAERAAKTVFLPQLGVGVNENDGASSRAAKGLKDNALAELALNLRHV